MTTKSLKILFSALIILLIHMLFSLSILAEETSADASWEKYALGLELMVQGKKPEGLKILESVVAEYPGTKAAQRAEKYLDTYGHRPVRSGIVTFYLGNLATTTWAAYTLPLIMGWEDNDLVMGTVGLIGVGSGIYSSWLMTRDRDMSLGQDLWIEFIEAAAVTNFQYSYMVLGKNILDSSLREKINIGGQTVLSLTSRGLSYAYLLDRRPSQGRIFTVINAYAWSQYYLWVSLSEIFGSTNDDLNNTLAVLVPDLAAVGTYYLWEKADWSIQKAGIVSVSGLGGMLTGIFTVMLISEIFDFTPNSAFNSSLILGFSLTGKVLAAWATSGMEPDSAAEQNKPVRISFNPVLGPKGTGLMMDFHF